MGKAPTRGRDGRETSPKPRPWIGMRFECCNVYARLYQTADASAFAGHCPRCARPARVRIAAGGSKSRFFRSV